MSRVVSKPDLLRWLDENSGPFIQVADHLWENPELSWYEFESSRVQGELLSKAGFDVSWGTAGIGTALVAEWRRGTPVIGVLGEYDALPGLSQKRVPRPDPAVEGAPGHGCGHNLLGTGGLAAAVAVRRWLEDTGTAGTIRYYGCPAEEQISGKTFMARAGVFDDLDAALNFHPDRLNHPSKGTAVGVFDLIFRFTGRAAHAGGAPHEGRSALDAVELMNVGVNYLREHIRDKVRIHYVITDGGRAPNIVPEHASVWYFVRALDRTELEEVVARVTRIAEGATLMTDTTMERSVRGACSSVLNNHYLADLQYENMQFIGPISFTEEENAFATDLNRSADPEGRADPFEPLSVPPDERVHVADTKSHPVIGENFPAWDEATIGTGSTDVGDVSWITPLSMLRTTCFPTGAAGHSWAVVAAVGTSIGHKGMMHAAKIMAATALDLFAEPKHLSAAKEEHRRRTEGRPYRTPLPDETKPPVVDSRAPDPSSEVKR